MYTKVWGHRDWTQGVWVWERKRAVSQLTAICTPTSLQNKKAHVAQAGLKFFM